MKVYYRHKITNKLSLVKECDTNSEFIDFIENEMESNIYEFYFKRTSFIVFKAGKRFVILGKKCHYTTEEQLIKLFIYYKNKPR